MMLGIGNSILGGIGSIAGNMAPSVGDMGGGGGGFGGFSMSQPSPVDYGISPLTNMSSSFNSMSNYVGGFGG
jgi:hypothetical protein